MAVWTYEPGGLYQNPQQAFDAMQFDNEIAAVPQAFTEVEIIRGAEGTYDSSPGAPTLRLVHSSSGRGILPTWEFPVIFEGTNGVTWIDTNSNHVVVGQNAAGTTGADYVQFVDLAMFSSNITGDIAVEIAPTAGTVKNKYWSFTGCNIQSFKHAVICGKTIGLRFNKSLLVSNDLDGAALFADAAWGDLEGILALHDTIIKSGFDGVNVTGANYAAQLFHSLIYAEGDALILGDNSGDWLTLQIINTVLQANGDGKRCIVAPSMLEIMQTNSNCYYPSQENGLIARIGSIDYDLLVEWQLATSQDINSISEDPLLTDPIRNDFRPQSIKKGDDIDSPLLLRGQAALRFDFNNNMRRSNDVGPIQANPLQQATSRQVADKQIVSSEAEIDVRLAK